MVIIVDFAIFIKDVFIYPIGDFWSRFDFDVREKSSISDFGGIGLGGGISQLLQMVAFGGVGDYSNAQIAIYSCFMHLIKKSLVFTPRIF